MPQIDNLISKLVEKKVDRAVLTDNEPLKLFGSGREIQGNSPMSSAVIETMLREIIPANLQPQLGQNGTFQFPFQSFHGIYSIEVDRTAKRLQVAISPFSPTVSQHSNLEPDVPVTLPLGKSSHSDASPLPVSPNQQTQPIQREPDYPSPSPLLFQIGKHSLWVLPCLLLAFFAFVRPMMAGRAIATDFRNYEAQLNQITPVRDRAIRDYKTLTQSNNGKGDWAVESTPQKQAIGANFQAFSDKVNYLQPKTNEVKSLHKQLTEIVKIQQQGFVLWAQPGVLESDLGGRVQFSPNDNVFRGWRQVQDSELIYLQWRSKLVNFGNRYKANP